MSSIYAIIGKPVLHSMSPQMHNALLENLGIDGHYIRIAPENREDGLRIAKEIGVAGMNITAPFKDIIGIVDEVEPIARKIGAVNTVLIRDGRTTGYNTDYLGVVNPIKMHTKISGKKAVVLGAGGAARAAVVGLLEEGAEVTIANRTKENAEKLAKELGCRACSLDQKELENALHDCSIIIGCLSTGEKVVPKELLRNDMTILEAYYSGESALLKDGREAGAIVLDGMEWLVYQGVRVFELFTGKVPDVELMKKSIEMPYERKKNIALVGMMGSGKNSAATSLAGITGMKIFDTDNEIEKKTGQQINGIFEKQGEEEFRKLEKEQIRKIEDMENTIINCGGGAVLDPENRKILQKNAIVVWCWADARTIQERTKAGSSRPLLNVEDPQARIADLIRERKKYYSKVCDMVIGTAGKTPQQIAERIDYEIRKTFGS